MLDLVIQGKLGQTLLPDSQSLESSPARDEGQQELVLSHWNHNTMPFSIFNNCSSLKKENHLQNPYYCVVFPIFNIEALTPVIKNVHLGVVGGGDWDRKANNNNNNNNHDDKVCCSSQSFNVDSLL